MDKRNFDEIDRLGMDDMDKRSSPTRQNSIPYDKSLAVLNTELAGLIHYPSTVLLDMQFDEIDNSSAEDIHNTRKRPSLQAVLRTHSNEFVQPN